MGNNTTHDFELPIEQIEYCSFETLKSTHTFVLNQNWYGRLNNKKVIVVFAEEQTEGVGSHNRDWISSGADFHTNFVFLLDKVLPFTQIAAYTVCQFLNRLTSHHYTFKLKWPNDICIQGSKIGGCISYVRNEAEYVWATVGIGINFNLPGEVAKTVNQPIISLKTLLGNPEPYSTSELFKYVQDFAELFVQNLHWYHQAGIEQFFRDVASLWLYRNDRIRIYDEDKKQWFHGVFEDVNPNGCLVMRTGENKTVVVLNGTQLSRKTENSGNF